MNQNDNLTWTIAIIAQVDTIHQWEFNDFKKNIEFPERVNNIRYVMLEYRQKKRQGKKNKPSTTKENQPEKETDGYTIWEISKRYPILKKLAEIKNATSIIDNNLIENFLKTHVTIPEQSTDRYMLILWGHGAGLGFFSFRSNETKNKNGAVEKLDFKNEVLDNSKRRLNRRTNLCACFNANVGGIKVGDIGIPKEICDKINNKDIVTKKSQFLTKETKLLSATELSKILSKCFTNNKMIGDNKKLNVLIANSCYTNMFECGYVLKDNVQVYAASQSIVPFAGIDYAALFESLEDYPEQDPYELAYNITDTFQSRYTKGGFAKSFKAKRPALNVRDFSINVNSLEYYDKFFDTINKLAEFLIQKITNKTTRDLYLKRIDIARSFCGDFAQGIGFIDFSNFLVELLKTYQHDDPEELREIYKEFFFWKEKSLLSIVNPGSLFRFMPDEFYSHSPQLFSIFFPYRYKRSHVIKDIMENYEPLTDNVTCMNSKWQWPEFIKLYWAESVIPVSNVGNPKAKIPATKKTKEAASKKIKKAAPKKAAPKK